MNDEDLERVDVVLEDLRHLSRVIEETRYLLYAMKNEIEKLKVENDSMIRQNIERLAKLTAPSED